MLAHVVHQSMYDVLIAWCTDQVLGHKGECDESQSEDNACV